MAERRPPVTANGVAAPAVAPLPATPAAAASRLLGLLLAVSRARHDLTTMYTEGFLTAEGPQAELEAYRLLAELHRWEHNQ